MKRNLSKPRHRRIALFLPGPRHRVHRAILLKPSHLSSQAGIEDVAVVRFLYPEAQERTHGNGLHSATIVKITAVQKRHLADVVEDCRIENPGASTLADAPGSFPSGSAIRIPPGVRTESAAVHYADR